MLSKLIIQYEKARNEEGRKVIIEVMKDHFCAIHNIPRKILDMEFCRGYSLSKQIGLAKAYQEAVKYFENQTQSKPE